MSEHTHIFRFTSVVMAVLVVLAHPAIVGSVSAADPAPEVERNSPSDFSVTVDNGENQEFTLDASHEERNLGYVEWYVDGDHQTTNIVSGSTDTDSYTHTFDEPGEKLVEGVVYTDDGVEDEQITWDITVEEDEPVPPEAERNSPSDFSVTVDNGENQEFTLDASHEEGNLGYVEWYVDGEYQTTNTVSGSTDTDSYTHTFDEPGEKLVEGVVYTDDWVAGEQITWEVTVEEDEPVPPEAERDSPSSFSVTVDNGENQEFTLDASHEEGNLGYVEWYVDGEYQTSNSVSGSTDTDSYTHTFDEPGEKLVEGVVYTDDGVAGEQITWEVTVEEDEPVPPEAERDSPSSFSVTVDNGENQEFTLDASHEEGNLGYVEWYVDGEYQTSNSVSGSTDTDSYTHTFDEPGEKLVEGVVYTDDGVAGEQITWEVTVEEDEPVPPEAERDSPSSFSVTVDNGENQEFTLDASHEERNLGYVEWYVDGEYQTSNSVSGSTDTDSYTHTFDEPGEKLVEGVVYTDDGVAGEQITWEVTVEEDEPVPPEAERDSPSSFSVTVDNGENQEFTLDASHEERNLGYVEWYVDGEYQTSNSVSGSTDTDSYTHTFDEPGEKLVEGVVYTDDGVAGEQITWEVTVEEDEPVPPEAERDSPSSFSVTVDNGENQEFTLDASHEERNLGYVEWYVDGEYQTSNSVSGSTDTDSYTHTFDEPGEKLVEGVVYTDDGVAGEQITWEVTVEEDEPVPPEAERDSPSSFSVTVDNGENQEFTLDASHEEGNLGYVEWYVDGEYQTSNSVSGSTDTDSYTHTFDEPGEKLVEGVVYTDDGVAGEQITWEVTVEEDEPVPPEAERDSPSSFSVTVDNGENQEFTLDASHEERNLGYVEWYVDGEYQTSNSVSGSTDTDSYTHTFDEPGEKLVEGVVYTDDGVAGEQITWEVTVEEDEPVPPEAERDSPSGFSVTVDNGENQEFTLDASHEERNLGYVEWYVDGEYQTSNSVSGSTDTDSYTHTFDEPGEKLVEGVVYTDDGVAGEQITWEVTVEEDEPVPPEAERDSPSSFSVTVDNGENQEFTLDASHEERNLGYVEWYVDGEYQTSNSVSGSTDTNSYTHTFDEPGEKLVEGVVYTDDGVAGEQITWEVTVEEQRNIDAQIEDTSPGTGEYNRRESVETTVTVKNVGTQEHTFYIGYSVRGPDGDWWNNDGSTHEPVRLDTGERKDVRVSWTVEDNAPLGEYDILTAVYKSKDGDELETKLAERERSSVFKITKPTRIDAEIAEFTVARGEYQAEETVSAEATVENTGTTKHTFYIDYNAIGPNNQIYASNEGQISVRLVPGEQSEVSFSWTVTQEASSGTYDANITIRESNSATEVKLDETRQDAAFDVKNEILPDSYEPNNNFKQVKLIEQKERELELTLTNGDVDVFELPVEPGKRVRVSADYSNSDISPALGIYDATRQKIDYSDTSSANTVTARSTADSSYYIVQHKSNTPTRYSLKITIERVESSYAVQPDRFEENDKKRAAKDLSEGTTNGLTITRGDPDYYTLNYAQGDPIIIDITPEARSEITAVLQSPSGKTVKRVDSSASGMTIEGTAIIGGFYTLKITSDDRNRSLYSVNYGGNNRLPAIKQTTIESLDNFGDPGKQKISNYEYVMAYAVGLKSIDNGDQLAAVSGFTIGAITGIKEVVKTGLTLPTEGAEFFGNLIINFHETLADIHQSGRFLSEVVLDREVRGQVVYHVLTQKANKIEQDTPPMYKKDKQAAFSSGWVKGYVLFEVVMIALSGGGKLGLKAKKITSLKGFKSSISEEEDLIRLTTYIDTITDSRSESIKKYERVRQRLKQSRADEQAVDTVLMANENLDNYFGSGDAEDNGDIMDGIYAAQLREANNNIETVEDYPSLRSAEKEASPNSGREYLMHNVETGNGEFDLVKGTFKQTADGERKFRVTHIYETSKSTNARKKEDEVVKALNYIDGGSADLSNGLKIEHFNEIVESYNEGTVRDNKITTVGPDGIDGYDDDINMKKKVLEDTNEIVDEVNLIPGSEFNSGEKKDRDITEQYDINGDGDINMGELQKAISDFSRREISLKDLQKIIDKFRN